MVPRVAEFQVVLCNSKKECGMSDNTSRLTIWTDLYELGVQGSSIKGNKIVFLIIAVGQVIRICVG